MKKVTLTKTDSLISDGRWTEWHRVTARIAKGLAGMVDCEDVTIQSADGTKFTEHKYSLVEVTQDSKGRWIAEFSIDFDGADRSLEGEIDEQFAGSIKLDVAMALGLTDDQIEINWRAQS